ncbi:hypothetical protein DAPPUDRAFT_337560 [Daphnia pulex]|uniref:Uncharacterized protein n=1 Tax=Daphnia pulex TaxID=6669 RepID=E9I1T8_DAPPU|nr:hypothetical protein DAPPUDRAFT_337560 [Daphnia pulex]|eukprot:EFX62042.1 hypothetical protein DAPPUDRAFT_337560 [Daphnia pulex]
MTIRDQPLSGSKYTIHRISVANAKRTNGKWTVGYPMDVLWTMCASRADEEKARKYALTYLSKHQIQIISKNAPSSDPILKPKNARNLCPASLSSLFKRFPLLNDHCNVVEADKEWRSHVDMPIDYFEIDSSQSTFAFYNMMDVEFYWNRVFAGFAAKLPNGEPQFPTLKRNLKPKDLETMLSTASRFQKLNNIYHVQAPFQIRNLTLAIYSIPGIHLCRPVLLTPLEVKLERRNKALISLFQISSRLVVSFLGFH